MTKHVAFLELLELLEPLEVSTIAAFSLDAFSGLAQRYTRPLHAFLCGLVHDPELARDILQDTYCAAWSAAQKGVSPFVANGDEASMRRWLYRVAYRRAVDTLRHQGLIHWHSLNDLDEDDLGDMDPSRSFERLIAEHDAMRRALQALSVDDVACLLLMVVQDFTAREAAAILDTSPTALGKRIGRAKRRLLSVYLAQNASMSEELP